MRSLSTLLVLTLAFPAFAVAQSPTLVDNGSFETPQTDPQRIPGWLIDPSKVGTVAARLVKSGATAGTTALELTIERRSHTAEYGFVQFLQQQLNEQTGLVSGRYRLTADIRFVSGFDSAERTPLRFKVYRSDSGDGVESSFLNPETTSVTLLFDYKRGYVNLELDGANYSDTPVVVVLDNVRLESVAP